MASLKITDIRLAKLSFELNERGLDKEVEAPYRFKVGMQAKHSSSTGQIKVRLQVTSATSEEEPEYPFFFDVIVVGTFETTDGIPAELMDQYAKINCPALMFPYLRETIADVTRRAGLPALHLPPINFVKQAGKFKEETKEQTKTSTGRAARTEKTTKKVASKAAEPAASKKTPKNIKRVDSPRSSAIPETKSSKE
jgi:preprotein translocase subunit SecB